MLKINLTEGTKYDKKAWTRLIDSGLFEESEAIEIIKDLFEHQISAFRGKGHSWLDKYIDGIARMLLDEADGDADVVRTLAKDTPTIDLFNDYLTWVKNSRPKIENQKDREKFDSEFVDTMSLDDLKKRYDEIKADLDAQSKEELANMEDDSSSSNYELVPIESYKQMHDEYGGHWTGDGSSDAYAGGGGSAWCHTNNLRVYDDWVNGGKYRFFVLQRRDWKDIPFNKETCDATGGKDEYGNSLIAIKTDRFGNLIKNTLRGNHKGNPVSADMQYATWAELSQIAGFNLEKEVAKYCDKMPEGLEIFSIDEDMTAIFGFNLDVDKASVTTLNIPEGISMLKTSAFSNLPNLVSVTLPSTLTHIQSDCFMKCAKLESVKFPSTGSLVSIGFSAFRDCVSLKEINVPSSTKQILESAFEGCSSLTKFSFPKSLVELDDFAFLSSGLKTITLPPSLKVLGHGVFKASDVEIVVFTPMHLEDFRPSTFNKCHNLKKVILPNDFTEISERMFCNCHALTDIKLPKTITHIGHRAFFGCSELGDIGDIDLSKVDIEGDSVFYQTKFSHDNKYAIVNGTLTSVMNPEYLMTSDNHLVIPEGVTAISAHAFDSADDFTEISFPDNLKSIGRSAFNMTDIQTLNIPDSVEYVGRGAFNYCSQLKSVKLPNNPEYTTIYKGTFNDDTSLTEVIIPNTVKMIQVSAFSDCRSLTKVTIPDSVAYIMDDAFMNCDLRTLTIKNPNIQLARGAFSNNKHLMAVQLPFNLKWKDVKSAFEGTPFYQMKEIEARAYGESYKRQQMTERLSLGYNDDRSVSEDMELNLEARSWGRSRSNHQYKDLEATRGTTCTLADIQRYVDEYEAEDITNYTDSELKAFKDLHKRLEVIGKSRNGYGYNGALLKDKDSGELFAITKRGSNLSALVRL